LLFIYPGSFDPIAAGHLDIIERLSTLLSSGDVAVLRNSNKTPLFTNAGHLNQIRLSAPASHQCQAALVVF